jgi:hypothetical protein
VGDCADLGGIVRWGAALIVLRQEKHMAYNRETDYQNNFDERGKFKPGNKLAKGNPFQKEVARLTSELYDAAKDGRFKEATEAIFDRACAGDVAAYKVLSDRLLGKARMFLDVSTDDGKSLGLTLADIQIAIYNAVKDDPKAKLKVAAALKELAFKQQEVEESDESE